MNSENCKTSKPHVLILHLTNKIDLRRGEKSIVFSNLSYLLHMEKHLKNHITIISLKYLLQHGMMNLNC